MTDGATGQRSAYIKVVIGFIKLINTVNHLIIKL